MRKERCLQTGKKGIRYAMLFVLVWLLLLGLLVCSALIPRSAIREKTMESAEYLCEGALFGDVIKGVDSSRIDRYADSILLGIAYQYDAEHPLRSVAESAYYYTEYQNENDNLLDAVTFDYRANQQYLRYWHGSNALVRPLLLFFNIRQLYVLNGVVLAVLAAALLLLLVRHGAYAPAVGLVVGFAATGVWFVPFSLEYTWTWLVMLGVSIAGVRLALAKRWNRLGALFLLSGMLTSFLDFLTTETLTLTVPLLLILWLEYRAMPDTLRPLPGKAVTAAACWGAGYAGMWVMKWLTAAVVMQENVLPYLSGHIEERLGGAVGVKPLQYTAGAVARNVSCLFPFSYGAPGGAAGGALLLYAVYLGYVYHKEKIHWGRVGLLLVVGVLPLVRYLVLRNHSYLHYFFTFRAQLATVLALVLALTELVEWRYFTHADAGKRKP